jgi:hypothetical protein
MRSSNQFDKAAYYREWRKTPRGVFTDQRQSAHRRGIVWEMTFEQWLSVWGDKLPLRGRGSEQYCMARTGDKGPYAIWNVRVITGRENRGETKGRSKEGWVRWRASRDEKKRHALENA